MMRNERLKTSDDQPGRDVGRQWDMAQDADRRRLEGLRIYLDEVIPRHPGEPHPFFRFHVNEIVRHPEWGLGIVTGFRMPDFERELEGLGIQFVRSGEMTDHRVFTPREVETIETTGFIFYGDRHRGMTLEDVIRTDRGEAPLPGLRESSPDDTKHRS
ncbi:hypothetical protein JXA80_06360 [bacterium]|nr:hypothetical protein [candidate division CSSED10-310 bacterium]